MWFVDHFMGFVLEYIYMIGAFAPDKSHESYRMVQDALEYVTALWPFPTCTIALTHKRLITGCDTSYAQNSWKDPS
jgi:hypothetical protein